MMILLCQMCFMKIAFLGCDKSFFIGVSDIIFALRHNFEIIGEFVKWVSMIS